MKRVLITGIGGFMGSHVLRHLILNTDWEIVGIDSFKHRGKTDRISTQMQGLDWGRLTVLSHDLTVPFSEQMNDKIGKIDYILNIASESHVDRSITDPRAFIENNTSLMLTMLEFARNRKEHNDECSNCFSEYGNVEKFIHISTDEVYGPALDHNHIEGEPHRPSNPYSASKAAQESIAYSYWRTYGLPIIITNTMNIIGETQDSEKYLPMIMKAVESGSELTIHASKDGVVGTRYYLHARNQADALLFLLKNHTPARYPSNDIDRFNIVGEKEVSNLELAEMVAGIMGRKLNYKLVDFHSSRPGHDLRYGLNGSKIAGLGWKAPLSFGDSLKTTIEWTLNNKEWL